ncbi:prolipoprotein diacylglyceryl transferase, partial [Achromatium sp. WMS1]
GILGVIIGGRLGYVLFYQFARLVQEPLFFLRIWEGGMSFHGGLLGVLAATWFFAYSQRIKLFAITDFLAPLTPIGLGMGRIGNFINGELWGVPTQWYWGMRIPCQHFPQQCADTPWSEWSVPLHPSQLYEAALEGLGLFILLWWFTSYSRPTMAASGLFLIAYAIARSIIELVRQPDVQLGYMAFGWMTMGHILSIPMLMGGLILLILAYWQHFTPTAHITH